jgi:hypothetical protein
MAYEHTEVPVARTQEALRRLLQTHKGFGLAVISEQDPTGREASVEGFQAKVLIDGIPFVVKIMAKVKAAPKYSSDNQKQLFRDQEVRRIWRVLYYHMKGVFEAADTGVMEFRELMLPYIVLPSDGRTIAEHILPQLARAMAGDASHLLPEKAGSSYGS